MAVEEISTAPEVAVREVAGHFPEEAGAVGDAPDSEAAFLKRNLREASARLNEANARVKQFESAARAYKAERELYRSIGDHIVSLGGEHPLEPFVEGALGAIQRMTRAERGCIVVYPAGDGPTAPVVLRTARFTEQDGPFLQDQISTGIIGEVRRTGVTVHSRCAFEDDHFASYASVRGLALRSVLCVPIPAPGGATAHRALGAIYLDNRRVEDAFSKEARQAIELFGRYLGLWIDQHVRGPGGSGDDPTAPFRHRGQFKDLVGRSASFANVLEQMDRLVRNRIYETTLLCGETGTGKELVAKSLHAHSGRAGKPFVAVNCAAIPTELVESELFGSRPGAFTGAVARGGLFMEAHGGMLFLDEIGDMPPAVQVKLLRALQERKVRPVGGSHEVSVDVWLVAATHRELAAEVSAGRFRNDLFYRLNQFRIDIPPLRDRPEDAVDLARHFLESEGAKPYVNARFFAPEAVDAIRAHAWPGNVREVQAVVQRAAVRARGPYVGLADIDLDAAPVHATTPPAGPTWDEANEDFQRRYLAYAVEAWGPNVKEVAARLGVHRSYLYKLLDKHGMVHGPRSPAGRARRRPGREG